MAVINRQNGRISAIWVEIKALEQQYKRLQEQQKSITEEMSDVSFRVGKLLNEIHEVKSKEDSKLL